MVQVPKPKPQEEEQEEELEEETSDYGPSRSGFSPAPWAESWQAPKRKEFERAKAVITRVVSDVLVFAEVQYDGEVVGLVFKPDKIIGYRGEPLTELGFSIGQVLPEIVWNVDTLEVQSVALPGTEPTTRAAGA